MRERIQQTKIAFEDKLVRIAVAGLALPGFIALIFLYAAELSVYFKLLVTFVMLVVVFFTALSIRQMVIFQLRTSTNLVEAMISGDYSLRANNSKIKGALADFNLLLNGLAKRLSEQSMITREKQILLSKITDQIDVAVIAVDENGHITLMNPAAEQLFQQRFEERQGWPISSLGLQNVVEAAQKDGLNKVSEFEIGDNKRKVYVRTDRYFELGRLNYLIFVTDIQHILRDEERQAWQRLLRVLSHEINNSLAPIASIAETLTHLVQGHQSAEQTEEKAASSTSSLHEDMQEGLSVISERAHALNHFIQDYQQLTRLPPPNKTVFSVRTFLLPIRQLFEDSDITMPEDDIDIFADAEQLQQVFINLIKNAQEANLAADPKNSVIQLTWATDHKAITFHIQDQGKGIHNTENLFVPFYTTKKQGSGIGLILSRQIVLNHGGDLTLSNATQGGARASLRLPIQHH